MKCASILAVSAVSIRINDRVAFAHPHYPPYYRPERETADPTFYPTAYEEDTSEDSETEWPTPSPSGGDGDSSSSDLTDAPTAGDYYESPKHVTAAPTIAAVATPMPVEKVVLTTASPTETPVAFEPPAPTCPNALDGTIKIDSKATLYYAVVPSSPSTSNNGMLCARLEAENGEGWIGLAISTNGKMVGSEAVIGIPDEGSVLKYNLYGKGQGSVIPMDRQTLRNVSIRVGDEGMTIMEFTKLLLEDDEIPILEKGINTFLHARGGTSLGYHDNGRLSFEVDFAASYFEAYNFNDAVIIEESDPPIKDQIVDVVNGIEFKPSKVAEAATGGAFSTDGYAAVVLSCVSVLIMRVL